MMGPSVHLRIAGIAVHCHLATPVALAVLLYGLDTAQSFDPASFLIALLAVFVALAAHDAVRALAYHAFGVRTRRIDLLLAGGASRVRDAGNRPAAELLAGAAGVLASAALAAAALLVRSAAFRSQPWHGAVTGCSTLLVAAALAQTLPALPLDGGRMLRALVWFLADDPLAGTRAVAFYGQLLAAIMIVGGGLLLAAGDFWPYVGFGGLVLGVQITIASASMMRDDGAQAVARVTTLDALALAAPATLDARLPVAEGALRYLDPSGPRWLLLLDASGCRFAYLNAEELRRVPRREWQRCSLGELAHPLAGAVELDGSILASDALDRLERRDPAVMQVRGRDQRSLLLVDAQALLAALHARRPRASETVEDAVRPATRQ